MEGVDCGAIIDGDFYPYATSVDSFLTVENEVLGGVKIVLCTHGGYDEGEGENAPENCRVEMCVFYRDEPSSIDLNEALRASISSNMSGSGAVLIAMTKLRDDIDKIIDEMRRGER